MELVPEPELMEDRQQALAYAQADFREPHDHFVALFSERFPETTHGTVLDLGCGPGDICRRLSRRFPACEIHAVDGSPAMLELGRKYTLEAGLEDRIHFVQGRFPDVQLPQQHYPILISNSLLHHLHEPAVLWNSLKRFGAHGAAVFIMDLSRPASRRAARRLVEQYAAGEADILQQDFFNSLLAAWRPDEVVTQLQTAGLEQLSIETVSDRHFIISGYL